MTNNGCVRISILAILPYLTAFVLKNSSEWGNVFVIPKEAKRERERGGLYLCLLWLLPVINLIRINLLTLTRPFRVISASVAR